MTNPEPLRIAVAGDVHGHLALLFAILGRWQRETGQRIDLILQVGDLGAFGPTSMLDRATRRHAEHDPEELGFADFAGEEPPATLLDPRPPLVFIPGNHEDFAMLEQEERDAAPAIIYPVTRDRRILGLKSGAVWTFQRDALAIRIAGVRGVAHRAHKPGRDPRQHLVEEHALRLAAEGSGRFDLFISHERPVAAQGRFRHDLGGSEALQLLLEVVQPQFAFFGHYDRHGAWSIGDTRVIGLAGVGYGRWGDRTVKPGGIVLLEWDGARATMAPLAPPWLARVGPGAWRAWR
jgi:hypothetical protein